MNKAVKAKWIVALRSGQYKQTKNMLRKNDSFCCLGVLCNLHAQEHPEIAAKEDEKYSYLGNTETLPKQVMKWADLKTADGFICLKSTSLSLLNDNGHSFKQIAAIIEENL
jgi:hypothetical protein